MKLIDNLPNHLKGKKDYLLKLKDSIDIPIVCIKYRKYRLYVIECGKGQDGVDIKPATLQDLIKMVKQEIKGDNTHTI